MKNLKLFLLVVSSAVLPALFACSRQAAEPKTAAPSAAQPAAKKPVFGTFGLDLESRDTTLKPGDDFFHYATGRWIKATQIPADRARWGSFDQLASDAESRVRALIEEVPADATGPQRQVADYYKAFLDTAGIDRLGIGPAKSGLDAIDALKSVEELAALVGRPDFPAEWPVGASIDTDQKNPDRYIVSVQQSGLSLPDRDYYLKGDPALKETREKFLAHLERMLKLAGTPDPKGEARKILALETKIAQIHWPAAKRRDVEATYNLRSREQLAGLAPKYPWDPFLKSAGLEGQKDFVVREIDAVARLAKLVGERPLSEWKPYLKYHYLVAMADVLPRAYDEEKFSFYGRDLNGQVQQRERWKRAVASAGTALGEAVGELYVSHEFPPESKEKMQRLVENLRAAYSERIRQLTWMSEDTKKVALEKLRTFRPKIGYPDRWRDYSSLEIRRDDAFGNWLRAAVFDWNRRVSRMGKPTDRDEWQMTPQTVNAYYDPTFNEIVFPAAILQAPFFDPNADDAVNYGAIGGVIGHEMGHGFDDQGAKSDPKGVLRTWWQPKDEESFRKLTDGLATQYDQYEALPGFKVNGRLTLGENIGDLGGLSVAHEAYKISLNGRAAPQIDGLSGDQRFFLSWAQSWRQVIREARLRNQILSDPHSPAQFRVNGVVRNMDDWYAAFNVAPGDQLYLEPAARVHIW
jgi:predicted metalloendopeptidase